MTGVFVVVAMLFIDMGMYAIGGNRRKLMRLLPGWNVWVVFVIFHSIECFSILKSRDGGAELPIRLRTLYEPR